MDQHTIIRNDNNDLENNMILNRNDIIFNQFYKKDFNKPVDRSFMSSHKEKKGLEVNFDQYSMVQNNRLGHNNFANNSSDQTGKNIEKSFDKNLPPNIYHNISQSGRKQKQSLCFSMRN